MYKDEEKNSVAGNPVPSWIVEILNKELEELCKIYGENISVFMIGIDEKTHTIEYYWILN